ncbi:MAG: DUF3427 domain-containing protein, partial [Bacteroidota bacterium]
ERIIETVNLYGCDNGITRGLIFCSSKEESKALSIEFNKRGFKTISLLGKDQDDERAEAILKLESDPKELDYIFTVDIFNEGIDIPKVNQIIMLRPTQSAIVFVQQLGRGLRKIDGKEYLTVIDFIGNYSNNFLVPIALYGDTSYNKDTLRKLVASGSNFIPGTSTINFDLIAREKIFAAIDSANMSWHADLVKEYKLLKFKLGRMPMMIDFVEQGARDPFLYVTKYKSFFNFVSTNDKDNIHELKADENLLLELLSSEINNSKRVEESIILEALLKVGEIKIPELKELIQSRFGYILTDETINSCITNLNFEFIRKPYLNVILTNDKIVKGDDLKIAFNNPVFCDFLLDSTHWAILTYTKSYSLSKYVNGFIRYNKYSRKDVCRILNWPMDISSTMYGYRTKNDSTPCFVTYHKSDEVGANTNYNDHFIDRNTFAWESRSNRKIQSQEIQNVIDSNRILLFVKKEDGEGSDFYFMGDVKIKDDGIEQSYMPVTNLPVVHFKFSLDSAVEDSIYDYLTFKLKVDENIIESNSPDLKNEVKTPFRILSESEVIPFKNCIPLYHIKAAAGSFSELQQIEDLEWIELNNPIKYSSEYFVCQVFGESMNKIIPNNSWCLFKKDPGGTRNGSIVLVYQRNFKDSDFGNGYTVKYYESNKTVTEEGYRHNTITLKPNSDNPEYKNIVLNESEDVEFKVEGIYIKILS